MSKFQAIMDAKRSEVAEEAPLIATITPTAKTAKERDSTPVERKRGRPPGKRSDPNFEATTAYIRKDTHRNVKIALLHEGKGREFSELVEDLLAAWLRKK